MIRAPGASRNARRLGRARRSPWAVIGKTALLGALIALLIAGVIFAREAVSTWVFPSTRDRAEARYAVHESDAGYAFRYPSNWTLERQGRVTKVEHPSGNAVVSFDVGAHDNLMTQAGAYMASLRSAYDDVVSTESRRYRAGGNPALWISGGAVNEAGVRLRFLVNIVREPETAIYLGSAFVAEGEEGLISDAEAIVDSLRAQ